MAKEDSDYIIAYQGLIHLSDMERILVRLQHEGSDLHDRSLATVAIDKLNQARKEMHKKE